MCEKDAGKKLKLNENRYRSEKPKPKTQPKPKPNPTTKETSRESTLSHGGTAIQLLHSLHPHPSIHPTAAHTNPPPKRYIHTHLNITSYMLSRFLNWVISKNSFSRPSKSVSFTRYELCLVRIAGEGKADVTTDFGWGAGEDTTDGVPAFCGARFKPVGRLRSVGGGVGGSSNFGGEGEGSDIEGSTMGESGIRGEKGTVNGSVESWSWLIIILLVLRDGLGAINGSEDVLWKDGASLGIPGLDALKSMALFATVTVDGGVDRDVPGNSVSPLSSSSTSTGGSKALGCRSDEVGENTAASACACSPARSTDSLWNAMSV